MRTVASTANYNNEIGVPLTLCRIERGTEAVVCELGMRGAGQIAYLTDIAAPDVGVITSVGPVHLELMGTVEAVAAAKAEILELRPGAVAVVPYAEPLLEPPPGRAATAATVTFGEADGADVRLVSIGEGRAEIVHRGRTLTVPVSFDQRHNGVNLAAAVAACDALGADIDDSLLAGAATAEISRWRGERLPLPGGGVLIADCYNANPVSMSAALRDLVSAAAGRRTVAVLGDMAELGETAEGYHTAVAHVAADLGIDEVIAIGPLSRAYGGTWYPTLDDALDAVPEAIRPGDAVLVKASRSMGLEAIVEAVAGVKQVLAAGVAAMLLGILAGPAFIAFLRRNEFGQQIREEGPAGHMSKQGTPDAGRPRPARVHPDLVSGLHEADDPGARRRRHDGRLRRDRLRRRLPEAHQAPLAGPVGAVEDARAGGGRRRPRGRRASRAPLDRRLSAGHRHPHPARAGYYVFIFLVVAGAANAVNLTDGLDGLAAGTMTIAALTYSAMGVVAFLAARGLYPQNDPRSLDLAILAAALVGGCVGFLWYNAYPADVFMGDTGAFGLGGALAALAVFTKTEVLLVDHRRRLRDRGAVGRDPGDRVSHRPAGASS